MSDDTAKRFDVAKAEAFLRAATAVTAAAPAIAIAAVPVADVPGVGPTRGAPLGHGARAGGAMSSRQPMPAQVTGPMVRGLMGAPRR